MRIGIDIQSTNTLRTGIGRYAFSLIEQFKKIDKENQYFYYSPAENKDLKTYERIYWENVLLPKQAGGDKLDILHIPGFAPPVRRFCKLVVTIHDLIGMIFPGNLGLASRLYWSKWLPWASSRADKIIASSENTKKDIIKFLKVDESKIKVVSLAQGEKFKPVSDKSVVERVKASYGIRNNFFFSVSTIEPRKNFQRIIESFSLFKKNSRGSEKLVITGMKSWGYSNVMDKVKSLGLENDIIFTGYISDEELAALYSAADIFLFPSLYEGFGFPVLEAMACGTPVITSDTSSLPEVAGEAALKVDPYSVEDIYKAITNLSKNENLRRKLISQGVDWANKFSWERTAKETLKVYEELDKNDFK